MLPGCQKKEENVVDATIAYLEDARGLGSGYSKQTTLALSMMKHDYGFEYKVFSAVDNNNVKENAANAMKESSLKLIFGTSYIASSELAKLSEQTGKTKTIVSIGHFIPNDNVVSFTLRNEEASYLIGAIAATESSNGHVAYIGGFDDDDSIPFRIGFTAGAKTVNPSVKVSEIFLLSYNNPAKMGDALTTLVQDGCDVIFSNCGASILGLDLAEGAEDMKILLASGFDIDSPQVIARISTDVQIVVSEMLELYLNEELSGNEYSYGYTNGIFTISLKEGLDGALSTLERYKRIFAYYIPEIPRDELELSEFDFEYMRTVEVVDGD
jgi:basic membrane lipoprotein Med (substrate-binding protein (PBP1-ABC) superfamily)